MHGDDAREKQTKDRIRFKDIDREIGIKTEICETL